MATTRAAALQRAELLVQAALTLQADHLLRATLRCECCGGWVCWGARGWHCGLCPCEWPLLSEITEAEARAGSRPSSQAAVLP